MMAEECQAMLDEAMLHDVTKPYGIDKPFSTEGI